MAILNVAQDLGIGLTQFVSMGNKADVSGNDLLEHWEDDPETRVICMYLESFGNPRRFTEIAKRVTRKKPILVVKSGRTAEGARAASSHTGAMAGTDVTVSAFLDQCGVLRANTIEELFDVCPRAGPLPAAGRQPGGDRHQRGRPGDHGDRRLRQPGPADGRALRGHPRRVCASFLPAEASVNNPVDMIASANADSYARTLAAVLDDPGVDMAMVINVTPLLSSPTDILEAVGEVARTRSKPVLAVMMATDEFYESVKHIRDLPPVYRFPESAARVAPASSPATAPGCAGRPKSAVPDFDDGRRRGRGDPRPHRRGLSRPGRRLPGARPLRHPAGPLAPGRDRRGGAGRGAGDRLSGGAQGGGARPGPQERRRARCRWTCGTTHELTEALRRIAGVGDGGRPPRRGLARPGDGAAAGTR